MTMEPNHHPDDERLAAFAAGEPDVELRIHVQSCVRCRSVVDELTTLRTALAELPDLAPSRPLRLLPEVLEPEPSAAERLAGWTRRAFMPLLAAGFGLAIVGSVGTAGSIFSFSLGSAGAAPAGAPLYRDASVPTPTAAAAAAAPGATETPGEAPAAAGDSASSSPQPERAGSATSSPAPEPAVKAFEQPPTSTPRSLWPMVLFAGVALIVATLLLRWIVQPRAG